MLHIIVNKSIVAVLIDCLMPRGGHEHICRSLCSEKGILSEPAEYPHSLTNSYAIALS